MDKFFIWICAVAVLSSLLLAIMMGYLLILKRKSGISLIKIRSIGTISLFATSAISFISSILIFYNKETIGVWLIISLMLLTLSLYCLIQGLVQRNSISEKGIIVFTPFPYLLKWENIKSFYVNKKQIFLKKDKGYTSIDILNRDIKAIRTVISSNIVEML